MCLVVSVEEGTRHEAGDTVAINGELYSVDVMISQELLDALSAVKYHQTWRQKEKAKYHQRKIDEVKE